MRAPQPKEPKKAAEGETPAGGNKEKEKEKEEVPMVRVEAKSLQVRLLRGSMGLGRCRCTD